MKKKTRPGRWMASGCCLVVVHRRPRNHAGEVWLELEENLEEVLAAAGRRMEAARWT
jgi:hypothetical protein